MPSCTSYTERCLASASLTVEYTVDCIGGACMRSSCKAISVHLELYPRARRLKPPNSFIAALIGKIGQVPSGTYSGLRAIRHLRRAADPSGSLQVLS